MLGVGITEDTLNEMLNMVSYVEKYSRGEEIIDFIRRNLEDYIRQIKS